MSRTDEFRQYADEAMRWARKSTIRKDRLILINLARTWTEAAERSEHPVVVKELPPRRKAGFKP